MDGIPQSEIQWLGRFFSGRNRLHWHDVIDRSAHPQWLEQVIPWISLFGQGKDDLPIILPVFDGDGPSTWYAAARNESTAAALCEELTSMIGPSYSDFRGIRHQCDIEDEIEAALLERFGSSVFRFSPLPGADRTEVGRAVSLYLLILRRRPAIPDRTQQPFGKIRGDFDRALLAGNEKSASKLLEDLYATGRVNAEQRKFLDIRFLAGLGRVEELAHSDALIKSVMDISLPPQTIIDLVDALYRAYVASVELESDVKVVKAAFDHHVGKRFGGLFKERKGIRQPNVLKSFLLYELAREKPDVARCEAIVKAFPLGDEDAATVQRWIEHVQGAVDTAGIDLFEAARQAVADEEYERAVPMYEQLLPDLRAYSGLIRCAVEIGEPAFTDKVVDLARRAAPSVVERLNDRDKKRLASLSQLPAAAQPVVPPKGWIQWAEAVVNQRCSGPPIEVLERELPTWAVEDYIPDPSGCAALASIIGNAGGVAEEVFREAFPRLIEFFVERTTSPVRGFIPLYTMLLRIVAWNGSASADELELTAALTHAVLKAGPTVDAYIECLEALSEILAQNGAPSNINWALNLCELFAVYPAAEQEARLRLFMTVVGLLRARIHRVTDAQVSVLKLLVKDYGCEQVLDGFPSPEGDLDLLQDVAKFGGLIGIYTLTEGAGQRAKHLLQKLLPLAQVEMSNDFVATDRLKNLAASADVFVFAWKSSKHQAYYCIKDARGERPLQLPLGKGTASIVDATLEAVRALM